MPIEIERKFLVVNDAWKSAAIASRQLRDGLIARFDSGKVRVRLEQSKAWLTIKGPKTGYTRQEFEYQIPRADAMEYCVRSAVARSLRRPDTSFPTTT